MDTYTIAEAAQLVGTSRGKLYQALRAGRLQGAPRAQPGQGLRVTREALRTAGSPCWGLWHRIQRATNESAARRLVVPPLVTGFGARSRAAKTRHRRGPPRRHHARPVRTARRPWTAGGGPRLATRRHLPARGRRRRGCGGSAPTRNEWPGCPAEVAWPPSGDAVSAAALTGPLQAALTSVPCGCKKPGILQSPVRGQTRRREAGAARRRRWSTPPRPAPRRRRADRSADRRRDCPRPPMRPARQRPGGRQPGRCGPVWQGRRRASGRRPACPWGDTEAPPVRSSAS